MSAIDSSSYQVPFEATEEFEEANLRQAQAAEKAALELAALSLQDDDTESTPEEEEVEELVILHPEHRLVRRLQAALNTQLKKQLERINLQLDEYLAIEKEDTRQTQETGVEMFRIQDKLAKLHAKLQNYHQTLAEEEEKHRQKQAELEVVKQQHTDTTSNHTKVKTKFSQLQREYDKLMVQFVFTQGASENKHLNVRTLKNTKGRAGAEKNKAADEKWKQDLYVERLTKEMERLTEQIGMYESQTNIKAEENQMIKQALSEAEMEIESLVMVRKHLMQQWNMCLLGMQRRDEAFSGMQEALQALEDQMTVLDTEIKSYKKSTEEEQERNEALTFQLYWSKRNVALTRKMIIQKQKQQEALQVEHSTCLHILTETEQKLDTLTKETSKDLAAEIEEQKKQLEKESATRLDLEAQIISYLRQQVIHSRAARYSRWLTNKSAALKERKIAELWQKEDEMTAVALESNKVSNHLESLAFTQDALDDEIGKYDKSVMFTQAAVTSILGVIQQKQNMIAAYNRKIGQIVASTGREDLSPMQIKIETLLGQIAELAVNIKTSKQLWMKRQGTLIVLTQDIEVNSKEIVKLQTQCTVMRQKKIRWENEIEVELQELSDLEKNTKMLKEDLLKLNTLLTKNGQLGETLEQENVLMETDFMHRIIEAEREAVEIQMKYDKSIAEKERLLNSLLEAERQIMLWEKKIQLAKETIAAVDSEEVQGEIQLMKSEIHRMEVRISQLRKQHEKLQRDSEATVARRESIVERREAILNCSQKPNSKFDVTLSIKHLQRKIKDTEKNMTECEKMSRDLMEDRDGLTQRLERQKVLLTQLSGAISNMESELVNLQDCKDRDLVKLVTLQNRIRKLQAVCKGSYKPLSDCESVEAALKVQLEHVKKYCNTLHQVCAAFPSHRLPLRKLILTLEAGMETQNQ